MSRFKSVPVCCHLAWGPGILHVAHETSENGVLKSSAGPAGPQAVLWVHLTWLPFPSQAQDVNAI